jgi:hypothetical protein
MRQEREYRMAKKAVRSREWTKEDLRMLKTLGRAKTTAAVIAQKLKRSVAATYVKAAALGVSVGVPRKRKRAR